MSTSISQSLPANGALLTDNNFSLKAFFDLIYEVDLSTGTFTQARYKTIPGLILAGSVQSNSKLNVTWGVNISGHPGTQAAMDTVFTNATGKTTTVIDTVISWGLATNLKPSYLPADAFVFKAEGYIFIPVDGNYTFAIDSDDCSDLFIDGALKVSRYNSSGMGVSNNWNSSAVVTLTSGWHTICVRMEEGSGGDGLGLAWKKPNDSAFSLIDPSNFSTVLPVYYSTGDRVGVKALSGISDNMVINWEGIVASSGAVSVYFAITTDGVNPPTEWTQTASGAQISADGVSIIGKFLWTKIALSTTDTSITPVVTALRVNVPNTQTGDITFEIDRVSTFNSPFKQTKTITGVCRKVIAEWAFTNMIGGDWYWRCIASSGSMSSGYSNTRTLNINAEIFKRTIYQHLNVSKLDVWTKKRIIYQHLNVSKLDVWTKERALYDYENITSDPPTPFIESLSAYRGPKGSVVTISGNGFGYSPNTDLTNSNRYLRSYCGFVYIGTLLCSIISWSWNEITVQLPAEADSGPIKVGLTAPTVRDSNVKGYEVYDGMPTDDIGIELFICDKTNPNTILCQLDGAFNKAFQMVQNNPGSGSFSISRYDKNGGNRNYIADQNFVLCRLDGNNLFKWIIEARKPNYVDSSEKQLIEVSGRGVLSMLNWAVVYPEDMGSPVLDRAFTGTASKVLRTLVLEAQSRGGLIGVSVGWQDDKDSLGNIFTENINLSFHVGTPLLEVVTKFTEGLGYFDIEMTPNLELKIYKAKGVDLHERVVYRPGQAIISHQNQSDATKLVNDVLVEGNSRSLAIASHSASQAVYGRREGFLSASNIRDGLSEYGQAYLNRSAYPSWGIQGTVTKFVDSKGNKLKPFETYLIGDWIGWKIAPEGSDNVGFDGVLRVKGVTVNENDDTGDIGYVLELNNAMLENEIRLSQKVERMSQYSGGSDVLMVAPSSSNSYSTDEVNLMLAAKANTNHEHSFTDLVDAPSSLVADKYIKVNSAGNALELVDPPSGAGGVVYFQSRFTSKTGTSFVPAFDAGYLTAEGITADVSIAKLTVVTAGKYVVFFHQLSSTSGGTYLQCRKNGVNVVHAYSSNATTYDHSSSVILNCAAGDTIDFFWNGKVTSAWSNEHSSVYVHRLK